VRGANDAAKVQEGRLIDLVAIQQVAIVAKVAKKPMELPQCPLGAIDSAEKGPALRVLWLQNDKSELHEWFLGVPPIRGFFHTNQKHAIKTGFGISVLRV